MQFDLRDEPFMDSKDREREERIRLRRARINEKSSSKGTDTQGGNATNTQRKETDKAFVLKGKAQIHDSKRVLKKLLEEGDDDVTRVGNLCCFLNLGFILNRITGQSRR